jgi:hypothetical protein
MQTATPNTVTTKHPALPVVDIAARKVRPQGAWFSGDAVEGTALQIVGETL